jgi:glucokinase
MSSFIAIDVGGTQMRVGLYGEQGVTSQKLARISTKSSEGTAIERLIDLVASLWPENDPVAAIGIAAPGPIDPEKGIIFAAPNIPGWFDLPLRQIIEDRFHTPVSLGNDANLAAVGEWKYGAGQGHRNLLYITISTGIGGGVICDNRLLLGAEGLAAEVGHMIVEPNGPICGCGRRGHLEAVASGTAIARYIAEELAKGRESILKSTPLPTAKDASFAAEQGDELAIEALTRAGQYMGIGLVNFLHIFNPSIIILGGGVSRAGKYYMEPMHAAIHNSVISPQYLHNLVVTPAALGDDAGLLGALALARTSRQEVL